MPINSGHTQHPSGQFVAVVDFTLSILCSKHQLGLPGIHLRFGKVCVLDGVTHPAAGRLRSGGLASCFPSPAMPRVMFISVSQVDSASSGGKR